jgi:aminoglycoside 6'-N-acetyltransferase I
LATMLPMSAADPIHIRLAVPSDVAALTPLRIGLWPESPPAHHEAELCAVLNGRSQRVYPVFIFVAEEKDGALVGFLEANLRSSADGCDERFPVGYVEGWFVHQDHRGKGVGAALLHAAEDWARAQGCTEMASDTSIDNDLSQRVHEACGFGLVERSVLYKKPL